MAFKRAFFKLFSCFRRKTRKVSDAGTDAPSSPTCRLEESTKIPERRGVTFVVDVELQKVERCERKNKILRRANSREVNANEMETTTTTTP